MSYLSRELGWKDVVNQSALKNCSFHSEEITTIFLHQNQNSGQQKLRRLACMDCIAQYNGAKNISIKQAIENKDGERLPNWPPVDDNLMKEIEQQLQIHSNNKLNQAVNEFWERFQTIINQKIDSAKQKTLRQVEQISLCGDMLHQQYLQMISTLPFFDKIEQNRTSLEKMEREIDKYIEQTYALSEQNNEQIKKQYIQHRDLLQSFSLQEGMDLERQITSTLENISFLSIPQNNRYKQTMDILDSKSIQNNYQSQQQHNSPSYSPQQQSKQPHKKSSSDIKSSISSPQFSKPLGYKVIDDRFQMICSPCFESGDLFMQKELHHHPCIKVAIPSEISPQVGCQFYSQYTLQNDIFYEIEVALKNKVMSNGTVGVCLGIILDDYKDTLLYMNSSLLFSLIKGIQRSNSISYTGNGKSLLEYNRIDLNFCVQICINDNILRIVPKQTKDSLVTKKNDSPIKKSSFTNSKNKQSQLQIENSINNTCKIERNMKYRFCIFNNQPDQTIKLTPYIYTN